MNRKMIEELRHPPQSPEDCIFARTTMSLSADLETRIGPCQFGGKPDCTQCGCVASVALAVVGHHRVFLALLPAISCLPPSGSVWVSEGPLGKRLRGKSTVLPPPPGPPLTVISNAK